MSGTGKQNITSRNSKATKGHPPHTHASPEPHWTQQAFPDMHRYIKKKVPLHSPTLSSCKLPATKDARSTPQGPAASSPSACKSFIASWPKRHELSTKKGMKRWRLESTPAHAARFCWLRLKQVCWLLLLRLEGC
jgi:hypothetical protein